MTAALYLHRTPPHGDEELRYSLRTVHRLGIDEVCLLGDLPTWARDISYLPDPPARSGDKFARLWDALAAAVQPDTYLPEDFVLMNDDYHALRPFEPRVEHRGYLAAQVGHRRPLGVFFASIANTLDYLERERGIAEPLSYETHRPLPMRKSEVAEAIRGARNWTSTICARSVWGNLYAAGIQTHDVKVAAGLSPKHWKHLDLISTADDAWQGEAGAWLREQSPDPSPWEVQCHIPTERRSP